MYARHVTVKGDPARIGEAVRTQRETVLPVLHACAGFRAQLVLVDRISGDVIGISMWATEEDMRASEEAVSVARRQVADSVRAASAPTVRLFEVAIFDEA